MMCKPFYKFEMFTLSRGINIIKTYLTYLFNIAYLTYLIYTSTSRSWLFFPLNLACYYVLMSIIDESFQIYH